jgi:phage terminase small subunit
MAPRREATADSRIATTGRKKVGNRREQFVREYLKDGNATQAALRAGYSPKSAHSQGARLLKNVEISARLASLERKAEEKAIVDAAYVLTSLKNIAERCQQAEPVLDREGNETGEYRFDSVGANRSLDLLGKYLGLFTDKLKVDFADVTSKTDAELEAEAKAMGMP